MTQSSQETQTAVKTYSAPDKWLQNFLLFLLSLTAYLLMIGWRVWPVYQRVGLTSRMFFYLAWFGILMAFLGVVLFKSFKRRKWRYEIGPDGIALLEGNGTRRLIRWEQIEDVKEDMNGGSVTIRDKGNQNRFLITRTYTDFEELKRRVYERWGRLPGGVSPASSEKNLVYPMSKSVKTTYLVAGLFFLLFSLLCVVGLVGTNLDQAHFPRNPTANNVIFALYFFFFSAPAVYCLVRGPKISKSKIETNSEGIARVEGNGTRVFIPWGDIGHLTKRERMKQLGIYDRYGTHKIMVDYQFERFDQIKDRILEECLERFQLPPLPATYGRLPVLPDLGWFVFIGSFIALLLWIKFTKPTTGGTASFILLILMLVACYLSVLLAESKQVKALILDGDGMVLCRIFGKVLVPWGEVEKVELDSATARNGRYMFVKITIKSGKDFILSWVIGNQLEAYVALKQMLGKRQKA